MDRATRASCTALQAAEAASGLAKEMEAKALDPGPHPSHAALSTPEQPTTTTTTTKLTQHAWKDTDNDSDNDEHATRENPGDEGTADTEPVPTTKHQRTETTSTQPKRWVHNHAAKQRSQGTTMATTAARHGTKNNQSAARYAPLNKPLSEHNGPGGSAAQPGPSAVLRGRTHRLAYATKR